MKKILITFAFTITTATAVYPQPFSPCLIDLQTYPPPPGIEELQRIMQRPPRQLSNGMLGWPELQRPDPIWSTREAFIEPAVKVVPMGWYLWEFYMPAAGRCVGAFDSYADINDASYIAREMLGQYTRIPMSKPTGDVDVMVLTAVEYDAWRRGRSTTTRGGSRGLSTGGSFAVDLYPGWHYLVISNRHSGFTAKTVSIMFGGRWPERKM